MSHAETTDETDDDTQPSKTKPRGSVRTNTDHALADAALRLALDPATLRDLQRARPGAWILTVPDASWVGPVAGAVCHIGSERVHIHATNRPAKYTSDETYFLVARLLSEGRAVVGISHEPELLPPALLAVARTMAILPPSYALVSETMKRCMIGRAPAALRRLDFSRLGFNVLCACMPQGLDKREAALRFKAALAFQARPAVSTRGAVDLGAAVEFGQAQSWGLDLALDLEDYRRNGLSWDAVDRGVVVHGPPGTGKTSFARSLAQKCDVPLVISSIAELFASSDGHLDGVIKALRQTFAQACNSLPAILFFDEIDALPDPAKLEGRHKSWWAPVIADFLLHLDSAVSARSGLVVIGATNNISAVSPAVLRPGRLERAIYMGPPDAAGLERVLRHHLGADLKRDDLADIVAAGLGATSAVGMEWVRAARRVARRQGRLMKREDLELQIFPAETRSDADRWRTAVHEAGHAVCGIALGRTLQRVSIRQDRVSAGRTQFVQETGFLTQSFMERELVMLLAGQAAEAALCGSISTGAGGIVGSDLHKATELAAAMRGSFGMRESKLWLGGDTSMWPALSSYPGLAKAIEHDLQLAYTAAENTIGKELGWIQDVARLLMTSQELTHAKVVDARPRTEDQSEQAA